MAIQGIDMAEATLLGLVSTCPILGSSGCYPGREGDPSQVGRTLTPTGRTTHPLLAHPWRRSSSNPPVHRWWVTSAAHHLYAHLSEESSSCVPQNCCWQEGWLCSTRCGRGRQLGAVGRAALMAEECDVPPGLRGGLRAGSALHGWGIAPSAA